MSSDGNISPQSTAMMSSPYSNSIMFLPISPSPPSGITRSFSAAMDLLQEPHLLRLRFRRLFSTADLCLCERCFLITRRRPEMRWDARARFLRCVAAQRLLEELGQFLEVRLDHLPQRLLMKRCRRMIHRNDDRPVLSPRLPVDLADRVSREVPLHRMTPERHDHFRLYDLDL